MRLAAWSLLLAIAACSGPAGDTPPPTTTTTKVLSAQELVDLERTPGVTPPLGDAVDPPTAPVAGLDGAPGPSPAFGPENAPVRIWMFTDFQCPVCRRAVEPVKRLARSFPNDVRLVFKNNALVAHTRSVPSATAGLAALRQKKFWAFHDRIFTLGQYDDDSIAASAPALGMDPTQFQHDMADAALGAQIRYETALAAKLGLGGTPGFVINGKPQVGWGSYNGMAAEVGAQLDRAKKIAAGGVPAERVAFEATRQVGPDGEALAAALFPASAK